MSADDEALYDGYSSGLVPFANQNVISKVVYSSTSSDARILHHFDNPSSYAAAVGLTAADSRTPFAAENELHKRTLSPEISRHDVGFTMNKRRRFSDRALAKPTVGETDVTDQHSHRLPYRNVTPQVQAQCRSTCPAESTSEISINSPDINSSHQSHAKYLSYLFHLNDSCLKTLETVQARNAAEETTGQSKQNEHCLDKHEEFCASSPSGNKHLSDQSDVHVSKQASHIRIHFKQAIVNERTRECIDEQETCSKGSNQQLGSDDRSLLSPASSRTSVESPPGMVSPVSGNTMVPIKRRRTGQDGNSLYQKRRREHQELPSEFPIDSLCNSGPYVIDQASNSGLYVKDQVLQLPKDVCDMFVCDSIHVAVANRLAKQIRIEIGLDVHPRRLLVNVDVYDQVEDAMARGTVFVLVLKSCGPRKLSATVFLLYGTPEEHRDMAIQDAVGLLQLKYANYLSNRRVTSVELSSGQPLGQCVGGSLQSPLIPNSATRHAICLLAADQFLTANQIDDVIAFLQQRRRCFGSVYDEHQPVNFPLVNRVDATYADNRMNATYADYRVDATYADHRTVNSATMDMSRNSLCSTTNSVAKPVSAVSAGFRGYASTLPVSVEPLPTLSLARSSKEELAQTVPSGLLNSQIQSIAPDESLNKPTKSYDELTPASSSELSCKSHLAVSSKSVEKSLQSVPTELPDKPVPDLPTGKSSHKPDALDTATSVIKQVPAKSFDAATKLRGMPDYLFVSDDSLDEPTSTASSQPTKESNQVVSSNSYGKRTPTDLFDGICPIVLDKVPETLETGTKSHVELISTTYTTLLDKPDSAVAKSSYAEDALQFESKAVASGRVIFCPNETQLGSNLYEGTPSCGTTNPSDISQTVCSTSNICPAMNAISAAAPSIQRLPGISEMYTASAIVGIPGVCIASTTTSIPGVYFTSGTASIPGVSSMGSRDMASVGSENPFSKLELAILTTATTDSVGITTVDNKNLPITSAKSSAVCSSATGSAASSVKTIPVGGKISQNTSTSSQKKIYLNESNSEMRSMRRNSAPTNTATGSSNQSTTDMNTPVAVTAGDGNRAYNAAHTSKPTSSVSADGPTSVGKGESCGVTPCTVTESSIPSISGVASCEYLTPAGCTIQASKSVNTCQPTSNMPTLFDAPVSNKGLLGTPSNATKANSQGIITRAGNANKTNKSVYTCKPVRTMSTECITSAIGKELLKAPCNSPASSSRSNVGSNQVKPSMSVSGNSAPSSASKSSIPSANIMTIDANKTDQVNNLVLPCQPMPAMCTEGAISVNDKGLLARPSRTVSFTNECVFSNQNFMTTSVTYPGNKSVLAGQSTHVMSTKEAKSVDRRGLLGTPLGASSGSSTATVNLNLNQIKPLMSLSVSNKGLLVTSSKTASSVSSALTCFSGAVDEIIPAGSAKCHSKSLLPCQPTPDIPVKGATAVSSKGSVEMTSNVRSDPSNCVDSNRDLTVTVDRNQVNESVLTSQPKPGVSTNSSKSAISERFCKGLLVTQPNTSSVLNANQVQPLMSLPVSDKRLLTTPSSTSTSSSSPTTSQAGIRNRTTAVGNTNWVSEAVPRCQKTPIMSTGNATAVSNTGLLTTPSKTSSLNTSSASSNPSNYVTSSLASTTRNSTEPVSKSILTNQPTAAVSVKGASSVSNKGLLTTTSKTSSFNTSSANSSPLTSVASSLGSTTRNGTEPVSKSILTSQPTAAVSVKGASSVSNKGLLTTTSKTSSFNTTSASSNLSTSVASSSKSVPTCRPTATISTKGATSGGGKVSLERSSNASTASSYPLTRGTYSRGTTPAGNTSQVNKPMPTSQPASKYNNKAFVSTPFVEPSKPLMALSVEHCERCGNGTPFGSRLCSRCRDRTGASSCEETPKLSGSSSTRCRICNVLFGSRVKLLCHVRTSHRRVQNWPDSSIYMNPPNNSNSNSIHMNPPDDSNYEYYTRSPSTFRNSSAFRGRGRARFSNASNFNARHAETTRNWEQRAGGEMVVRSQQLADPRFGRRTDRRGGHVTRFESRAIPVVSSMRDVEGSQQPRRTAFSKRYLAEFGENL